MFWKSLKGGREVLAMGSSIMMMIGRWSAFRGHMWGLVLQEMMELVSWYECQTLSG